MNKRSKNSTSYKYYPVILDLARNNRTITGDTVFNGLLASDCSEDDTPNIIGSLIRMAAAEGLIEKTNELAVSERNRSSIQRIWRSQIFKGDEK